MSATGSVGPAPAPAPSGDELHPQAARVAAVLAQVAPGTEVRQLGASTRTAKEAADALGCEVGAIASSLVFMADDGPVMVLTSGAHRVDLDVLGPTTGLTGLRRATPDEVRSATGQAIGGVSPLGHPRALRTFVDEALADHKTLWAAAGTPHSVFATTCQQLLAITSGTMVRVAP
ncbi:MAG TPA: YbaK/EbsC family protein [Acidimicrobiales bacterium]|nr:YbaK/EbsC family protein [Acidimicrobiales bacterium]